MVLVEEARDAVIGRDPPAVCGQGGNRSQAIGDAHPNVRLAPADRVWPPESKPCSRDITECVSVMKLIRR